MGLMSSYLSKPATDKESTDESNDKLVCGASSMQGWRLTQEDAHNCLLDYDHATSFFAVYDGHGGHEVALYCSQKLPDYIKNTDEYKAGKIEEALTVGFLGFDATIATDEVREELEKLAGEKKPVEESDEEENVDNLYEEAAMPIEQVIEKYKSNSAHPAVRSLKSDPNFPKSPNLKAKRESDETVGTSSACSSSSDVADKCGDGVSSSSEADTPDQNGQESEVKESNGPQSSAPDSSDMKVSSVSDSKSNGEVPTPDSEAQAKPDVSSSSAVENGTISTKGKGKAVIKPETKTSTNTRPKRNAKQLYKEWLDFGVESEDSDEEDQNFEGPNEESTEDESEGVNTAIEVGSEEDSSAEEEEDEDEEDDDDDEDDEGLALPRSLMEKPGLESGCTAVVALLKGNELYVANAGDSRCIVCRGGKAIEMSFDHKPEDKTEWNRIKTAGGYVSCDGRVNSGLNLSRAIGDHTYKQNKELSDREQMITALPDIKTLTIGHEDEFMVLACDGIWNFMSSQEVVDFVKLRIAEGREKLSHICEEMFDHCLAPATWGDGTGCDNMTAIIVKFNSNIVKRPSSTSDEEADSKRAKTDEESEAQIDTTV